MNKKLKVLMKVLWRHFQKPVSTIAAVMFVMSWAPLGNRIGPKMGFVSPMGYRPVNWPDWEDSSHISNWMAYGMGTSVQILGLFVALTFAIYMISLGVSYMASKISDDYKRELRIVEKAEAQGGAVTLVENAPESPVEPSGGVPGNQPDSEWYKVGTSPERELEREMRLHSWTDLTGKPINPALRRKVDAELAELRRPEGTSEFMKLMAHTNRLIEESEEREREAAKPSVDELCLKVIEAGNKKLSEGADE